MKYLLLIITFAIFGWGGKVQVRQATSQEWVGGLQESGYGTDFKLEIRVKANSDRLKIEELWVGDLHMNVRVITDPANPKTVKFSKGQVVTCKAAVIYQPGSDHKMKMSGADLKDKPFNFKGAGLLGYTYKGRKLYVEINELKTLEKIIYP
jgi:hypothetical protein